MGSPDMTIEQRLSDLATAHKPFRVVTTYADGQTKALDVGSMAAGETHAFGERRKIGRNLIDRMTGQTVRVVSVEILPN